MEENMKHHHLSFKKTDRAHGHGGLEEALLEVKGVKRVVVEYDKGDVFVEYDIEECTETVIEKVIQDAGLVLDDSITQRIKRGWIHYTEDNIRDNLHVKTPSCCDIDEIERKRKELE